MVVSVDYEVKLRCESEGATNLRLVADFFGFSKTVVIVPFSGMMVRTLKLPTSNLRTHKNNIARRFGGTEVVFFVARVKLALKIDPCYER